MLPVTLGLDASRRIPPHQLPPPYGGLTSSLVSVIAGPGGVWPWYCHRLDLWPLWLIPPLDQRLLVLNLVSPWILCHTMGECLLLKLGVRLSSRNIVLSVPLDHPVIWSRASCVHDFHRSLICTLLSSDNSSRTGRCHPSWSRAPLRSLLSFP